MADKSQQKEEASAPQIHLQGSSARGGPSPGTSSSIRGDLPDAIRKREKRSASQYFAQFAQATRARLAKIFGQRGRRPRQDAFSLGGDVVGLHGHKEQLIKLLLEDNSGTTDVLVKGGSGVTALVRNVCEDVHARELFDTIAWISVPQRYDSELFREEILLQLLFENAPFPDDDSDADGLAVEDFKFSSKYKGRCLIVVDNLVDQRAQIALNKVCFSAKTYRVIFIARRDTGPWSSPLDKDGRQLETFELDNLAEEEPWAHFGKKSPSGDFPCPLKEVCQLLVRKFESLPAAIVLHLRKRKETNIERKSVIFPSFERSDEWAPMNLPSDNFPSFNLIRQVLEILYTDDHGFCLLYLSILPENSMTSCNRVSRLWAAEGFLPDLGEAEGFFNNLLEKKCIHPAEPVEKRSDGQLSTFRVDNLVQEIIASLSHHCNLARITDQASTKNGRYLCFHGTIRGLNEEKTFQLYSTFTLDVSSNENKTTTSEASPLETFETPSFPSKLKYSKVLDLTGGPFQILPDGLVELIHLRYWSIRNTSIEVIPGSIGELTYLEFLDAKHSLVTELPPQVARLKRIRHILIYHHEKDPVMESYKLIGFKASCRVGGFLELEKLCFVEADKRTLKDLRNLTKLKRLGITELRKEHGEELCTSLEKLKQLKSLNVHALDEDETIDLHGLSSPPKYLKHLYLHGHLEKLPDWISSCKCLTKILLRWSHLEEDLLSTLGKLPALVELELRRAYDGEQLDFKKGQFPKLKILLLEELEELRSMTLEKEAMPCLEDLTISRCEWLEIIPSGIEHIPTIRKLMFFDMSHEFYEKVRADHEKDDYKKFEHIPEVYFTRWRAAHWTTHSFLSQELELAANAEGQLEEQHCPEALPACSEEL